MRKLRLRSMRGIVGSNSAYWGDRVEVLVLDSSWQPLGKAHWSEAVGDIFAGRAEVIVNYDKHTIRCVDEIIPMPAVVRFKGNVVRKYIRKEPMFNRTNVWQRDGGKCCYCNTPVSRYKFTYDHVVPSSKGGATTWENIVTSCSSCNTKKGSKAPHQVGMALRKRPHRPAMLPKYNDLEYWRRGMPEEWRDFLKGR